MANYATVFFLALYVICDLLKTGSSGCVMVLPQFKGQSIGHENQHDPESTDRIFLLEIDEKDEREF